MSAATSPLAERFVEHVTRPGSLEGGETLVVALSGGVDSVALLHLLRFSPGLPPVTLVAVHVDHAMRPGSEGDAAWVAGLCRAWGVDCEVRRLTEAPAGEAEARVARYTVLEEVRAHREADLVLTAHHGDDQAETVLFRALRGTGLRGLRGIAERRPPALWRPLLPFERREIMAYARRTGLTWREDPSNVGGFARNVLRHQVLPLVEQTVAAGARGALRRLARRAREDESAWRSLEPGILAALDMRRERDGFSVDREEFLALHAGVRGRVVRGLVRRLGGALDDAGTRLAVEFTRSGSSGGGIPLGRGIWLRRALDRLDVVRGEDPPPDRRVSVPGPGAGKDRALLGGRAWDVEWDVGAGDPRHGGASFSAESVAFPLTVRSWAPGDRMRLAYGSKKLKKLFLEARIPPGDRRSTPVLVDDAGVVLWVPGVARSVDGMPDEEGSGIHIYVTHADSD